VGSIVQLAPDRDYAIISIEVPSSNGPVVRRAREFQDVGGGLQLPTVIETESQGRIITRVEVEFLSINEPIPATSLVVQFPEGSRVDDQATEKIHVWGTDSPAASFESEDEFDQYVYARAREYQSGGQSKIAPAERANPEYRFILIGNVILVTLIIVLTVMRRRLAKSPGPTPPGSTPAAGPGGPP
jgi:hypothetical protein